MNSCHDLIDEILSPIGMHSIMALLIVDGVMAFRQSHTYHFNEGFKHTHKVGIISYF